MNDLRLKLQALIADYQARVIKLQNQHVLTDTEKRHNLVAKVIYQKIVKDLNKLLRG